MQYMINIACLCMLHLSLMSSEKDLNLPRSPRRLTPYASGSRQEATPVDVTFGEEEGGEFCSIVLTEGLTPRTSHSSPTPASGALNRELSTTPQTLSNFTSEQGNTTSQQGHSRIGSMSPQQKHFAKTLEQLRALDGLAVENLVEHSATAIRDEEQSATLPASIPENPSLLRDITATSLSQRKNSRSPQSTTRQLAQALPKAETPKPPLTFGQQLLGPDFIVPIREKPEKNTEQKELALESSPRREKKSCWRYVCCCCWPQSAKKKH